MQGIKPCCQRLGTEPSIDIHRPCNLETFGHNLSRTSKTESQEQGRYERAPGIATRTEHSDIGDIWDIWSRKTTSPPKGPRYSTPQALLKPSWFPSVSSEGRSSKSAGTTAVLGASRILGGDLRLRLGTSAKCCQKKYKKLCC